MTAISFRVSRMVKVSTVVNATGKTKFTVPKEVAVPFTSTTLVVVGAAVPETWARVHELVA